MSTRKTIGQMQVDWLIAKCDEDEIEDMLEGGPPDSTVLQALEQIDALKSAGTYESERERLAQEKTTIELDQCKFPALDQRVLTFVDRMRPRSRDPQTFQKIELLWSFVRDNDLLDVVEFLYSPPKRTSGRKSGKRQYDSDRLALRAMKKLIRGGQTIPAASRIVAKASPGNSVESTAKRLDRRYRYRLSLRITGSGEKSSRNSPPETK